MTTPLGGDRHPARRRAARRARPSPRAASTSAIGGKLDKDAFLQLLVASMKYQDPSKPTDSQAYMAQLAQFAQVEKLDAITTAQTDATRWQQHRRRPGDARARVTGTGATGASASGTVTGVTLTCRAAARLQLAGGGSLAVDDVTSVTDAPAPAPEHRPTLGSTARHRSLPTQQVRPPTGPETPRRTAHGPPRTRPAPARTATPPCRTARHSTRSRPAHDAFPVLRRLRPAVPPDDDGRRR